MMGVGVAIVVLATQQVFDSKCVFASSVIQHAIRMRHVICRSNGFTMFFRIIK